jgi:hypothetical protein
MAANPTDSVFDRLATSPNALGAFSMDVEGNVQLFSGDFGDGLADMYAPVILSMLMDVKGVLDTRPVAGRVSGFNKTPELLKRVVCKYTLNIYCTSRCSLICVFLMPCLPFSDTVTYASFTLIVSRVGDVVYVLKTKTDENFPQQ